MKYQVELEFKGRYVVDVSAPDPLQAVATAKKSLSFDAQDLFMLTEANTKTIIDKTKQEVVILEEKNRMITKKTIELELECLKRLRKELVEALDRYDTQVCRVSNLVRKTETNEVWLDESICQTEVVELFNAMHKADNELGVTHEL